MDKLLVSIVIPCQNNTDKARGLLNDLSGQKVSFETEIIIIPGISPAGKARNAGAKKAKGEILIFIDCDIRLGNGFVLNNLVNYLLENKNIGIVSSSIRVPPDASPFQLRYAQEIPNSETPIVDKLTDVGIATSACCAVNREVFFKIGGFNEHISRGQDPEFSFRLRKLSYRTVLAPNTWVYHPAPDNIRELIKIHFRNGLAVSFVDTFYPECNIDVDPRGIIYCSQRKGKFLRALRYISVFFQSIIQGKFLLLLAKIVYLSGYAVGFLKY